MKYSRKRPNFSENLGKLQKVRIIVLSKDSTIYWLSILVRVSVLSKVLSEAALIEYWYRCKWYGLSRRSKGRSVSYRSRNFRQNLKGVEYAILTRCVPKFYINGWSCIVNAEDKEYLLPSMKRLNELASVIREALENEGILAS